MRYGISAAAGLVLFVLTNAYMLGERGYFAIGGEGIFLLLPLIVWVIDAIREVENG